MRNDSDVPNSLPPNTLRVYPFLIGRYDIVLHSNSHRVSYRRIQAQSFADDSIEVRQVFELIHVRRLCRQRSQFLAEFRLRVEVVGESEERPGDSSAVR